MFHQIHFGGFTHIIIGPISNLTSLTLLPIKPVSITSNYRFRNTILSPLTSFAQAAAASTNASTNASTGVNFRRCLQLRVVRIPIFFDSSLIMNTFAGMVFTLNKAYWLQFDEAFKALAAIAAPNVSEVKEPRVVLIFDVSLGELFMPRIKECLPSLSEIGLVDIVVKSAREFERDVEAEIEGGKGVAKYLEI
jgi:hypothetical protein